MIEWEYEKITTGGRRRGEGYKFRLFVCPENGRKVFCGSVTRRTEDTFLTKTYAARPAAWVSERVPGSGCVRTGSAREAEEALVRMALEAFRAVSGKEEKRIKESEERLAEAEAAVSELSGYGRSEHGVRNVHDKRGL